MVPPDNWHPTSPLFGHQLKQLSLRVCLLVECVALLSGLARNISVAGCDSQWFGQQCDIACHCQGGCLSNGECAGGKGCVIGYFGPGCQYVDIFVRHNKNSPPYVADNNQSTCNPDKSSRELTIQFDESFHFSWLVLHVSVPDLVSSILVRINGVLNTCFMKKMLTVNYTIHIFCTSNTLMGSVEIRGFIVQHICSVKVNGGRDVTYLARRTNATRPALNMDVDNCTINASDIVNNEYNLTFDGNVVLSRVKIYRRPRYEHQGFMVRVLSDLDEVLDVHKYNGSSQPYQGVPILTSEPVTVVNIRAGVGVSSIIRFKVLCRVEVFGDRICPLNVYGIECEEKCSCMSASLCQLPTGMCFDQCPVGFYGVKCKLRCPANCQGLTCQRNSGVCYQCPPGFTGARCQDECPNNTYGDKCASTCSPFCGIGGCDKVSGDCTNCSGDHVGSRCEECQIGRFGPKCLQVCSTYCANSTCHIVTGKCFSCEDGHIGDKCTDCPLGKYGYKCSEACPEHCDGKVCYHDSGNCVTCKKGYGGVSCQEPVIHEGASDPMWLYGSIITVIFVLSLLFVFFLRERKPLYNPRTNIE